MKKTKNAAITPKAPHAKLTQSLLSQVQPRMWVVGVPQVWMGYFSVSLLSLGQKYMAWTVPPMSESKREPANPEIVTSRNSDQLSVKSEARNAINAEPAKEASVPINEIPPEVPFSTTFLKSVIMRGGWGFNTPSSVAHVSALTAARDAAKPSQGQSSFGKKK